VSSSLASHPATRAESLDRRTPQGHDRVVDLARGLAIVAVVVASPLIGLLAVLLAAVLLWLLRRSRRTG